MLFIFYMAYGLESNYETKEATMNRIFTLISFLLISTLTYADHVRLSITSLNKSPIRVMIDGQVIKDKDNDFRISNLNPGMHRIQIFNERKKRNSWNWGNNNNQNGQVIYNGTINARYGMHTDIIINRFGKVFIDEQPIDDRDENWNNGNWNNNNGNNGNWNNNNGNNNGWNQPMSNERFQQLKQMVQREAFDDNKMEIIKSAIPSNYISSNQVRELMMQMSFERNKLELAKFAYRFTADRSNFFIVNDVFQFSNSRKELSDYIAKYRD